MEIYGGILIQKIIIFIKYNFIEAISFHTNNNIFMK